MGGVVSILLVVDVMALVAVLAAGVVLMGMGGVANARWGNRLMMARVWLQGMALLLLALLFALQ